MRPASAPAPFRLRSITVGDQAGLTRFYAGLSPEGRAARFHGASPTIPDATATFFCGPDHQHREGIVAECFDDSGDPMIIGHVCIEPIGKDAAEMAIAVADTWHRQGVGRAMLIHAIGWAQVHGIARLAASIQSGNAAMFGLLRSTGSPITFGASVEGTVDAFIDVQNSPVAA